MYVKTDLFEQTLGYKYLVSIYMALAMLNGGECGPATTEQLIFSCSFILIGAIITANIFGTMAVIVSVLNRKESNFQEKLDLANTTMKHLLIPKDVQRKVINYIFYTESSLDQHTELNQFLKLISPSLRKEIIQHMLGGMVQKNSIFKKQNGGIINFIISNLDTMVFYPEDEVIAQGETADHMYFINKGDCEVSIINYMSSKPSVVQALHKGELFGELALINGGKRSCTVKALNYCSLAALSADNFLKLIKEYPNILEVFRQKARDYSDPVRYFIKDSMKYCDLFAGCDEDSLNDIIFMMKVEEFNEETIIQRRLEIPQNIIFIAAGEIKLTVYIYIYIYIVDRNGSWSRRGIGHSGTRVNSQYV